MASDEVIIPANNVSFAEFCILLENIQNKKAKPEKEKVLTSFFNNLRIKIAEISGKKSSTFYPLLRLLLPDKERERSAYNLKEKKLGQLLIKVLSLSKLSNDATKLSNFRTVNNSHGGDFGHVAYYVLKNRMGTNSGTLTVGDINNILDKIAAAETGNKAQALDEAFRYVINNISAEQMKWFLRIVLKDLKLGIGLNRILACFNPDAPTNFDNCGNLAKVCEELQDGDTRPLELGVKLFFAISPMLSERLNVQHVSSLPQGRTYQIEMKFDGERFQVHMENAVFEYFSRRGFKYADNFGKTFDSGMLTPHLKNCFSASVNNFVLDGEMMGWHKQHQDFGSKGQAFDVKKLTENSKHRPCFCVFDVLYYNGQSLVGPEDKGGLPLSKRLKILDTMFKDIPGVIQHSERAIVKNSADILDALNKAIEDQEEGIVVKDTESYYIPNRRNAGWYKIKPEYTDSTMSDLDLVIIGADNAEQKKHGRAKTFYVACADVVADGALPHRWVCVGQVATGFTYEEREKVCTHLQKTWVSSRSTPAPAHLVFNKTKPDYWILPEHSIALQVRATELIRSNNHGAEYTLRFPRVIRIRDDKPVNDVITLDAFNALSATKDPVVKLSTKRVNEDQLDDFGIKTPRKRAAKDVKVPEEFRTKPVEDIQVVSKALEGREVCILSADEECSKQELLKIVLSHSGTHVVNVGRDTWCGIVGRLTPRVRKLIAAQEIDITTTTWLRSLPNSDTPCSLRPCDMLSIKKSTRLKLSREYDQFGDSYREDTDEQTLKKCFRKMNPPEPEINLNQETAKDIFNDPNINDYVKTPAIYLTRQEMLNIDKELFGDHNPFSYLRPCVIHFTRKGSVLELRAKMYGATTTDSLESKKLTHVVVSDNKQVNLDEWKDKVGPLIVSEAWVAECLTQEKLVPERDFLLNNDSL
ncbi:DNA ligase 4-like isoform X1 [Hyposmocoma kahamanoa]|uniref:DNA ligase 4-like isoform X1 n=1 Tax=Hyposmocoma kahamanoa TaxID=1477025 RepID=UPI000E6D8E45|nr:DNA ligase 4-like isoform X1 [Hyposmocoma kahamanoa]